jgi:hypothetical protein
MCNTNLGYNGEDDFRLCDGINACWVKLSSSFKLQNVRVINHEIHNIFKYFVGGLMFCEIFIYSKLSKFDHGKNLHNDVTWSMKHELNIFRQGVGIYYIVTCKF